MKWHQVRKVVETTTAINVNTSSSSFNKAAEKPALKSNRINMTDRCDTALSMRGLFKFRTVQAGAHRMTSALRSVMTSATLTLGGLKAAHAATMGMSFTPGHGFSAVARTSMRTARSGIALALLAGAGLTHAVTTGVPFTVPPGVYQIDVVISGGSGGQGGTDNSPGGPSGVVPIFQFALNVTPGEVLTGTLAAGGQRGVDGASCSGGGSGGSGDPVGGKGGNAGCESYSGGGAGGGGGTSLVRGGLNIFLAAGSGGGGGGSFHTTSRENSAGVANFTMVGAENCFNNRSIDGNSDGLATQYNGGGGGGGGGGYITGKGGTDGTDIWKDATGGAGGTSCWSTRGGIFASMPTDIGGRANGSFSATGVDGMIEISYNPPVLIPMALRVVWNASPYTLAPGQAIVTTTGGSSNPTLTSSPIEGGNSDTGTAVSVTVGDTITLPADSGSTPSNFIVKVSCNNTVSPVTNATLPTSFVVASSDSNLLCTYTYQILPMDPAHSGVRVVTNDKPASGRVGDEDVLELYVANANGYPMGGMMMWFDATDTVAFNGGRVGVGGSCVSSRVYPMGICRVTATSTTLGSKSTGVRLPNNTPRLAGNVTAYNNTYTPSPVTYNFALAVPLVRIVKNVMTGNGTNFFNFSLSGLSAGTDSIAVAGAGSGNGTAGLTGTIGLAVTISESSPAGWPVNPVSASCVDTDYVSSGNPPGALGTLNGNVLSLPAANMVPRSNFTCTFTNAFSFTVTGRAFTDNGIGGGAANDGVMNGGETGTGGVGIKLTNCAGGVISTATTDGNGAYVLSVPFSTNPNDPLCVEKTTLVPRLSTGASIAGTAVPSSTSVLAPDAVNYSYTRTGLEKLSFQWNGTGHYNLNFGDVEPNTFVANGTKSGPAGNSVSYSHTFNAKTGGSVSFSIASAMASPAISGWSEKVFADTACTGSLQAGAALLYPPAVPVTTTAGQIVCVVMQEFIPLSAPLGHTNTATVQASFTFTNASPALSATYSVTDVTTSGSGALDLTKEVRNVTTGGAFGLNNQAKSGETLEYRITYTNNGADPISGLSVADVTPNHTTFVSASNGTTPAALTSCQKQTPANPAPAATVACDAAQTSGGTGSVSLRYVGSVGPGAIGIVLFQVKVD